MLQSNGSLGFFLFSTLKFRFLLIREESWEKYTAYKSAEIFGDHLSTEVRN